MFPISLTFSCCNPRPFATGDRLWNDRHIDGAYSIFSHPKCHKTVGLPYDLELFANALNVNLGIEKVKRFWKAGKAYGI